VKEAPPNVVIVMADELRNGVVLHQHRHPVAMPNLDRLRNSAVTLEKCFCQTPTCCRSRGSFATGKYPHQLQLWNHAYRFPPEEWTMGHYFSDHGYDAGAFGKIHGMCPGFRSVIYDVITATGSSNHGCTVSDEDCTNVFEKPEEESCDFIACRQIDKYLGDLASDRPFLTHIGIYSPHPPLYPPRRLAEMYDRREVELSPARENEPATKPEKQNIPRGRWNALSDDSRKTFVG